MRLNSGLVTILILITLLRLPSWFEPYWYGDEGITVVVGWAMRHGYQLYTEIIDNKPPLLYLLAAIFPTLFWFKVFLTGYGLLTIVTFWSLSQRLFNKGQSKLSLLTTALFGLAITFPPLRAI